MAETNKLPQRTIGKFLQYMPVIDLPEQMLSHIIKVHIYFQCLVIV